MSFGFRSFLKKRLERKVFTGLPLTLFVSLFLILLATLIGLTESIVNSAPIVKLDASFSQFIFLYRSATLAKMFYIITNFADQITISVLLAITLAYFYFKKELAYLYALILNFIGTEASVYFIKIFINRDRPSANIAYYIENSKSFPSGHATIAVAFFGFIIYYLVRHSVKKNGRTLLTLLGFFLIALIGFSRIYLGVHYLSDVLGGFLIGGLWLVIGITFREHHFYTTSLKKGKN